MKKIVLNLLLSVGLLVVAQAQNLVRLEIGQIYTFESVSGPGLFISYGSTPGRVSLSASNKIFKVVPALNGKTGDVSLQAIGLSGENYVVMAEACPRPYTASNYFEVKAKPANEDATYYTNASFNITPGRSDEKDVNLVSFRTRNGTHFLKREQGVFMDAPGACAPTYFNHFTFKFTKIIQPVRLEIGQVYTFESVSQAGLFISYGATPGRVTLNASNQQFKVMPALNGKAGDVSLQAIGLSGEIYLVMAEACPAPYNEANYYEVKAKPSINDIKFNNSASFNITPGRSDDKDVNLVSFRTRNGTHFLKREQGVFMDAPGACAPTYFNHFTFKLTKK